MLAVLCCLLAVLMLRSSPRVAAMGRRIKGLYCSESLNGPHTLAPARDAVLLLLPPERRT
jgi:hypothetical protein